MNAEKGKAKKDKSWNEYAYLVHLANKKESVVLHLNTNTIEEESQLKGVIVHPGLYVLAFLTDDGRELLVFKHSIRYIELKKQK